MPIDIEEDCWLGARVTVLGGVTIGKGSVIAAGSVITRDVPPFSIVAGVPGRVVGSRRGGDDAGA
ncbi:DapH/DapD/GlmU-related protein [Paraburkholderia madseniana]|nr:DapH/DapD/GlmU-related protein [Paraburkholderia madseniana]